MCYWFWPYFDPWFRMLKQSLSHCLSGTFSSKRIITDTFHFFYKTSGHWNTSMWGNHLTNSWIILQLLLFFSTLAIIISKYRPLNSASFEPLLWSPNSNSRFYPKPQLRIKGKNIQNVIVKLGKFFFQSVACCYVWKWYSLMYKSFAASWDPIYSFWS